MRRFIAIAALGLAAAAIAVPALAGNGKGGGGGGGKIDPTTFAIASQAPGSVTFSVSTPPPGSSGSPSLVVTSNCYDGMSVLNYTASLSVAWATPTVGYAGPFAPPSGEKCYAYVHSPGSSTILALFSYVAA
jgi:hypothetical protein